MAIYTIGSTGARYTNNMKFELRDKKKEPDPQLNLRSMSAMLHDWISGSMSEPDDPQPFVELDAEWSPILKKLSATIKDYDNLDYFKVDED